MSKLDDRKAAFLQNAERIGREAHGSDFVEPQPVSTIATLQPSIPEPKLGAIEPPEPGNFSYAPPRPQRKSLRSMGYVPYSTSVDPTVLQHFKKLAFDLGIEQSVLTTMAFSLMVDEQTRPVEAEEYFTRLRQS